MNEAPLTPAEQLQGYIDILDQPDDVNVEHKYRVFCNRDINFEEIDAIGFDMDYTLAMYNQVEMDRISVELTVERLITERGYPKAIRTIEPKADFAIRGLVLDSQLGNILKLDSHRHVGRAYHGFEELGEQALAVYKEEVISFDATRFVFYDTLYALPEAFLYAALVDYRQKSPGSIERSYRELYEDIRHCIDLAHRDGSFKKAIMEDTARYVIRNDRLAVTLHRMRSAGKKLFLLTNSYPQYTDHLMTYLLDGALPEYKSWKQYFDVSIAGGTKPGFFTGDTPFYTIDEQTYEISGEEHHAFQRNTLYLHGNLEKFTELTGISPARVLYVGDHIYGDILRSKKSTTWRTCMLVQEMEDEMALVHDLHEDYQALHATEEELARLTQVISYINWLEQHIDELAKQDVDPSAHVTSKSKLRQQRDRLKRKRRDRLESLLSVERDLGQRHNPYWGLIFKMHNKNSVFGEQVEDYACLYTSRVANFANYSPLHYFRAPRQPMPHEMG